MKHVKIFLLVIAATLTSFNIKDSTLTDAERTSAINYLKETKENLMNTVKGLSEAQLNFKASPESWSVAECVEHIAISESNLFGMVQGTLKEAAAQMDALLQREGVTEADLDQVTRDFRAWRKKARQ